MMEDVYSTDYWRWTSGIAKPGVMYDFLTEQSAATSSNVDRLLEVPPTGPRILPSSVAWDRSEGLDFSLETSFEDHNKIFDELEEFVREINADRMSNLSRTKMLLEQSAQQHGQDKASRNLDDRETASPEHLRHMETQSPMMSPEIRKPAPLPQDEGQQSATLNRGKKLSVPQSVPTTSSIKGKASKRQHQDQDGVEVQSSKKQRSILQTLGESVDQTSVISQATQSKGSTQRATTSRSDTEGAKHPSQVFTSRSQSRPGFNVPESTGSAKVRTPRMSQHRIDQSATTAKYRPKARNIIPTTALTSNSAPSASVPPPIGLAPTQTSYDGVSLPPGHPMIIRKVMLPSSLRGRDSILHYEIQLHSSYTDARAGTQLPVDHHPDPAGDIKYRQELAQAYMEDQGLAVADWKYIFDRLPTNYIATNKPAINPTTRKQADRHHWLIGSSAGNFQSPSQFVQHFLHMTANQTTSGCRCAKCKGRF